MAAVEPLKRSVLASRRERKRVLRTQVATALAMLLVWEGAGASHLFYRGVLPSIFIITAALARLLATPSFYTLHLATTAYEVLLAFAIGSLLGAAAGLVLGMFAYTGRVMEPVVHYLAPTPKIVFLPVLLVMFGVGPGSKIALGAISCFFPMALSVASGVRQVRPALLRVGRSLRLTPAQMLTKIYIPELLPPIASGLRLSLGISIVGCLLAELKLSNQGLGFLSLEYYRRFDIASMFAVVIVIFALAAVGNVAIGRLVRAPGPSKI